MSVVVTLRPLTRQDIDQCLALERKLFAEEGPWSAHAFRTELTSDTYYLAAIDPSGELVGYAGLAILGRPGEIETEVRTIAVNPRAQRGGIGTALLTALLTRADELAAPVFLEVRTDNAPALRLYERYGFERIGLRKRYYLPVGVDAYTMRRPARVSAQPKEATD